MTGSRRLKRIEDRVRSGRHLQAGRGPLTHIFDALWPFVRISVGLAIGIYLVRQVRRPSKWIGQPFVRLMNRSHSRLTDWGLQHVAIEKNTVALDVGCGGGRTIEKLSAIATEGKIYGVDYGQGSVAVSRTKNAQAIAAGRVKIKQASVSELPFADNKFDVITAIETQYYWPDLPNDMREIFRVLKPGGALLIVAEVYNGGSSNRWAAPIMKFLGSSSLSADDQQNLFSSAGYTEIQIFTEQKKGWICISGKKPQPAIPSLGLSAKSATE